MPAHQTSTEFEARPPSAPVTGLPGGLGTIEPDVHVLDRLHVLYKYRKAMISVAFLVLIGGILQTYTTTPAFESTAQVRVEPTSATITALAQSQQTLGPPDPESFLQTELSVIGSRDLKRKIVRSLKLDQNPEFTTAQGPQGIDGQLNALRGRIMGPITKWLQGPAKPMEPGVPTGAPAPKAAAPEQIETPTERAAIETLSAAVTITPQPLSHLFTIKVSSASAATAAQVANEIAKQYESQNLEIKRADVKARLDKIGEFVRTLSTQIDVNSRNLITSTNEANVLAPDVVARNVQNAQGEMTSRMAARRDAEARMNDLGKLDVDKDLDAAMAHPEVVRLGQVQSLRQRLTLEKNERQRLVQQGFGTAAPGVRDADSRIAQTQEQIRAEIRTMVDTARTAHQQAINAEQSAKIVYDLQQKLQIQNSQNAIPYDQLRRQVLTDQTTLAELQKQQKDFEIISQGVDNNVSVVEWAQPASRPYKPNAARNILMSLIVGITLAIMLAFGLDYIDDTIKTPEDVTRKLQVPFLGLVPSVRSDRQPVLFGPVPHDFGEAYRALRTSLVFTSGGETTRMIAVTSAQPLEGKTTTACNLAMVLAFGGSRVLLIDADMRRPGVHKTLKMNNTVGLSHLLVGQARVRESIQRTADPNFCVMTAGRTPPNPSELLSSQRMKQLIANLKQGPFDWIVIDTPPVLAVTDAVILTPLVDGVTFVLGAEMTRRRLAERAVHMLMASRPRVIGGVLNRVNFDRNKYYYSRYYGYQYKSYYGTDAAASAGPKA